MDKLEKILADFFNPFKGVIYSQSQIGNLSFREKGGKTSSTMFYAALYSAIKKGIKYNNFGRKISNYVILE